MVQLKTMKDITDLLVSFNFPQKTPKSKCSSCANEKQLSVRTNSARRSKVSELGFLIGR